MSDISAIKTLIGQFVPGDISSLISIFTYQGFNPEMVMKHFVSIKTKKSISDTQFQNDLLALLCLACISGNYTNKNKDKRDEKGTAKANELFQLYELKMGSVGNDKRSVTLPRVALTFPILTCRVGVLCPEKNFSGPFSSSSLPHVMKNSVFPSLLPTDLGTKTKSALLLAYCCYTCDQSKAINPDLKSASSNDLFHKQYSYVEISHGSPEPDNTSRKAFFKSDIQAGIEAGWQGVITVLNTYKGLVDSNYALPIKFGTIQTVAPSSEQQSTPFD
jgi:hypothetical protein